MLNYIDVHCIHWSTIKVSGVTIRQTNIHNMNRWSIMNGQPIPSLNSNGRSPTTISLCTSHLQVQSHGAGNRGALSAMFWPQQCPRRVKNCRFFYSMFKLARVISHLLPGFEQGFDLNWHKRPRSAGHIPGLCKEKSHYSRYSSYPRADPWSNQAKL